MNFLTKLKSNIRPMIVIALALSGTNLCLAAPAQADQVLASFAPDVTYTSYWGSVTSPDGNKLYLVSNAHGILTVNISNPSSIPAGDKKPFATGIQGNSVAISPDGTKLYVAGGNTGPAITVVDVSGANAAQESFTVRNSGGSVLNGFFAVSVSEDGRYVYTTQVSTTCLYRFRTDRSTGQEKLCMNGARSGAQLGAALIVDHGDLYTLAFRSASNGNDQLVDFDISGDSMVLKSESWTVSSFDGVTEFYKNGKYIYATTAGNILKIDVSSNATTGNDDIEVIPVPGSSKITGLFVSADQKYAYFVEDWGYQLKKFDLVGRTTVTLTGFDFGPHDYIWIISYDPVNRLLVMTDDAHIKIIKIDGPSPVTSNSPTSGDSAKIAIEARNREIASAKSEITNVLNSGKPLTADQLQKADIPGVTAKNVDLINSEIAKLSADKKADIKAVEKVVFKYATVDKIAEHSTIASADLISVGLIPQDSKNKTSILLELKKLPVGSIDTYEEIQVAVAAVEKRLADRKAKLATVLARSKR